MKKHWKLFTIITDKRTNLSYIYFAVDDKLSYSYTIDGSIQLPETFKVTLYVEPILKQLKALGYTVKGERFLSQRTGNMETNLYMIQ
jgi:hypothetical protein